jgi:hypothetical protein
MGADSVPMTLHTEQVGGILSSDGHHLSADELTAINQLTALKTCVSGARQGFGNTSERSITTMRMIAGATTGAGPSPSSPPLSILHLLELSQVDGHSGLPCANDWGLGKSSLPPLKLATGEPAADGEMAGPTTLYEPHHHPSARQEPGSPQSSGEMIHKPAAPRDCHSEQGLEKAPRKGSARNMNAAQKHILKQHFVRDKRPRKDTCETIAREIDQLDGGKPVTARVYASRECASSGRGERE